MAEYIFPQALLFRKWPSIFFRKPHFSENGRIYFPASPTFPKVAEHIFPQALSKTPINESQEPVRAIVVDYTLEEELERGIAVDAEDFLNKMREKYSFSMFFIR